MQRITLAEGKTIDLKLPAGVETGTQMRPAGKGQPGPGGPGDGIVTLTVKDHPIFEREGANIRLVLHLTQHEAVKGAKAAVPRVDRSEQRRSGSRGVRKVKKSGG